MKEAIDLEGCYDYGTVVDSMGHETVLEARDDDYQGDSHYLLKDGERWGYLVFGWGSCSGCDALEACYGKREEVESLRDDLRDGIKWFDSLPALADYFGEKDWSTEWFSREGSFASFKDRVLSMAAAA
jgi:hypothetical protein